MKLSPQSAVLALGDDPLEDLDAFLVAFGDARVNLDRVARPELGDLLLFLRVTDQLCEIHFSNPCADSKSREKGAALLEGSTPRTALTWKRRLRVYHARKGRSNRDELVFPSRHPFLHNGTRYKISGRRARVRSFAVALRHDAMR